MKNFRVFPIYPILLCINPILALLATNIVEVDVGVVIRPLLISIAGTTLFLILMRLIFKDIHKAALVTSLFLILFLTYGHVYQLIEGKALLGVNVGRHRYLSILYIVIGALGMWWILRKGKDFERVTKVFNVLGAILVIVPLFQIISYSMRVSGGEKAASELKSSSRAVDLQTPDELPDIYYIVLDTYTRADALQNDFNFDNSLFLEAMEEKGFYVADCSRSNYSYTQGSITAALNLEYLSNLKPEMDELGLGMDDIWVLLKQSLVRRKLEAIGYQTVAFETGYEWSRLRDADLYIALSSNPYGLQLTNPFEVMLLKSTAALILVESPSWLMNEKMRAINFPYSGYAQTQLSVLDQLPKLASLEYPKFVFAHILVPHVPYVFDPQGEIRKDAGFYSGRLAGPINENYLLEGYTGEIEFINSQMLGIAEQLIENSEVPPIIIIHGDHGLRDENRLEILNLYYLPEGGDSDLYPGISPVNSFRIVFDYYYGTQYGLIADESFLGDDTVNPVPEYAPECQLNAEKTP